VIDVPVFVERRRSRATSANNGRHDSEKEQLRVEVPGDWRVHFCASSVARGLWPFHREGITPPLIQQRMSTTRRQTLWAIWATWWKPADVMNGRFGMQSSHTESYEPVKSGAEQCLPGNCADVPDLSYAERSGDLSNVRVQHGSRCGRYQGRDGEVLVERDLLSSAFLGILLKGRH